MKKLVFYLVIVLILLSAGCSSINPANPQPSQNQNYLVEIISLTEPIYESIRTETIEQQNCTGSGDVDNVIERTMGINHAIELGLGLTVDAVGKLEVLGTGVDLGAEISSELGYQYGITESISRSITVRAAPNTHMKHIIELSEVWESGTARITVDNQSVDIPFRYRADFSIGLINSAPMDCSTGSLQTDNIPAYDDFNDPIYEGTFNPTLWTGGNDVNEHFQKNGILTITQIGKPQQGTALTASRYINFKLTEPIAFEAKLNLDTNHHPNNQQDSGGVQISLIAELPNKDMWVTQCGLTGDDPDRAGIWCNHFLNDGIQEYVLSGGRVDYGTWHTFRMEVDPTTMNISYFINGDDAGSFIPTQADQLKDATFILTVNVWTNSAEQITGFVDDVRIYNLP